MKTPENATYFQLRYIYRMLYGEPSRRISGDYVLRQEDILSEEEVSRQHDDDQEEAFRQYLLRPAYERLLIPALRGCLSFPNYSPADPIVTGSIFPKELLNVKSNLGFIHLHFFPFYPKWKDFITGANNSANLQDLMGRNPAKGKQKRRNPNNDNGSGASLKEMFLDFLLDDDALGLQLICATQRNILDSYKYSPIRLRTAALHFFEEAQKHEFPDSHFVQYGILKRTKKIVMDLFSYCRDDSALTVMLLVALLRERAEPLLPLFVTHPCMESITLTDSAETVRTNLGEGYYLLSQNRSNYMGGSRLTDMTLYEKRDTFIRKISDICGYFFTEPDVTDDEISNLRIKAINFPSSVSPFRNGVALFTWMYRPDGRYWEDDDGFGRTNEDEINLYALMNTVGEFITPFTRTIPSGW